MATAGVLMGIMKAMPEGMVTAMLPITAPHMTEKQRLLA